MILTFTNTSVYICIADKMDPELDRLVSLCLFCFDETVVCILRCVCTCPLSMAISWF